MIITKVLMTVFLVTLCVLLNFIIYDIYIKEDGPKEKNGPLGFVLITTVILSAFLTIISSLRI